MGLSSQSDHFGNFFFGGGTCRCLTLFDEDVKLNSVVISDIDVITELRVNSWFMLVLTSERQETFVSFLGSRGLVGCLSLSCKYCK